MRGCELDAGRFEAMILSSRVRADTPAPKPSPQGGGGKLQRREHRVRDLVRRHCGRHLDQWQTELADLLQHGGVVEPGSRREAFDQLAAGWRSASSKPLSRRMRRRQTARRRRSARRRAPRAGRVRRPDPATAPSLPAPAARPSSSATRGCRSAAHHRPHAAVVGQHRSQQRVGRQRPVVLGDVVRHDPGWRRPRPAGMARQAVGRDRFSAQPRRRRPRRGRLAGVRRAADQRDPKCGGVQRPGNAGNCGTPSGIRW